MKWILGLCLVVVLSGCATHLQTISTVEDSFDESGAVVARTVRNFKNWDGATAGKQDTLSEVAEVVEETGAYSISINSSVAQDAEGVPLAMTEVFGQVLGAMIQAVDWTQVLQNLTLPKPQQVPVAPGGVAPSGVLTIPDFSGAFGR